MSNPIIQSTTQEAGPARPARTKSHTRFLVLGLIFFVTVVNYADRSSMSIAGTDMTKELGMTSVQLGFVFSAFSWAYVVGQLPGGYLLDRFGAKKTYGLSLALWSAATLVVGFVGLMSTPVLVSVGILFALRLFLGLVEAPAFPANARITTMWFPTSERGQATAVFNSAQYLATAMFAPIIGWMTFSFGWRIGFYVLGALGLAMAVVWFRWMNVPSRHKRVSATEIETIRAGGGLVDLDESATLSQRKATITRSQFKQLFTSRMFWGLYVAQYAVNALTYFFITWFPIYLVSSRHLNIMQAGFIAAIPALAGFAGGILGGFISDLLLRRGVPLTAARKIPSVAGMALAMLIMLCPFTDSTPLIVTLMTLAFFGKGVAALGWAFATDMAPKEANSVSAAIMNAFGNIAGIVTPIVIGFVIAATGNFDVALWFVGAHGAVALLGYLIMGKVQRLEFTHDKAQN
ncbi:ACS family glucarate transporter-like MFS transporter [Arthrobacter sp. AG258]|uniref:MFS transporter n=1 Tax=Arthrobacter sp. AG258 TaxID=2183899 RepID=UPI00105E1273|nr:MFS transporter [Arthrobacter sp. AG258]TDT74434.1 ACS family glucarate transporter-like MFS transporter [Arthrobacter sp. AG258]